MTKKNKELVIKAFQALASDLKAEELPDWLLDRGKALPFYEKAAEAKEKEAAFLALYNAYGTLLGFRPGAEAMAQDLGCDVKTVRAILAYIRRDDGDTDSAATAVKKPSARELDALKSGFRRRFLTM